MRRYLLLTLAVSLAALAQDSGDVELVIVRRDELTAMVQRLAALQAEKQRRDEADRAEKVRLGCT